LHGKKTKIAAATADARKEMQIRIINYGIELIKQP